MCSVVYATIRVYSLQIKLIANRVVICDYFRIKAAGILRVLRFE